MLIKSCDPVWIRTKDPQLRRLLLYPTELQDQIKTSPKDNEASFKKQQQITIYPPIDA